MDGTCVPWVSTAALPEPDKPLSLALVAPDSGVEVVVVKSLLGAWELARALGAPEALAGGCGTGAGSVGG